MVFICSLLSQYITYKFFYFLEMVIQQDKSVVIWNLHLVLLQVAVTDE
jgi:hypothetical protein